MSYLPALKYIKIALGFAFISGIMNILGIKLLASVTTNVTGWLSLAIQAWQQQEPSLAFLGYILTYLAGATWSSYWYNYNAVAFDVKKQLVSPVTNLVIIGYSLYTAQASVYLWLFAMSNHNAFASNHSHLKVKPSQITGLVMDMGLDLSRLPFQKICQKNEAIQNLLIKIFIIIGFASGGLLAAHFSTWHLLWLPFTFYIILIYLIINKACC